MNRTGKDFSDYVLIDETENSFIKYTLKHKDYDHMYSVTFITIDNKMIVYGDYGNWIFDRGFSPQPNNEIDSNDYVIEKLESKSTQNGYVYSEEMTRKNILAYLKEKIGDCETLTDEYDQDEIDELSERLNSLIDNCYNEKELYLEMERNNFPLDEFDFIIGYDIHPKLKYVFDYFDEICNRLGK